MQQPEPPPDRSIETHLLRELALLERQIYELEKERTTLQRLITKVRKESLANREVTRKNSVGRVLVENAILERVGLVPGRSVAVHELWRAASSTDLTLKRSTFRSHLHRLKQRGLIESPKYGTWRLVQS